MNKVEVRGFSFLKSENGWFNKELKLYLKRFKCDSKWVFYYKDQGLLWRIGDAVDLETAFNESIINYRDQLQMDVNLAQSKLDDFNTLTGFKNAN